MFVTKKGKLIFYFFFQLKIFLNANRSEKCNYKLFLPPFLDNSREKLQLTKLIHRLDNLIEFDSHLDRTFVDSSLIARKVVAGAYDGIRTYRLDDLAAEICAAKTCDHPDFGTLASRLAISSCHKNTSSSFYETTLRLRELDLISDDYFELVRGKGRFLDMVINHERDYFFDYFGFKTLEKSYLLRRQRIDTSDTESRETSSTTPLLVERPQHLLMRVALFIHRNDLGRVCETYDLMSRHIFVHATPTLCSAGTKQPSLSSCFLTQINEDSIDGIFSTLKDCARIAKNGGGIGLSVTNVRAKGSRIVSTNGKSNGIVPMLRVFSSTSHYVDQGGNKRPGAMAVYIEPWHADIFEFLDLRKNTGSEHQRARELFYALWIPDLFMRRVRDNADWSLFCPSRCPRLIETYGEKFEEAYVYYEKDPDRYRCRVVSARLLWQSIVTSQIETGMPFMLYKDSCNALSNQNHIGIIPCSNLCTEIIQHSDGKNEIAVCNLASLSLPAFVINGSNRKYQLQRNPRVDKNFNDFSRFPIITYDSITPSPSSLSGSPSLATTGTTTNQTSPYFCFESLRRAVHVLVRNLNRVIDVTEYPIDRAQLSNLRHRPIGIGVQGLADTFVELDYSFESYEARILNIDIFETIYFAALEASCSLAKETGRTYESYNGSFLSRGLLNFDVWSEHRTLFLEKLRNDGRDEAYFTSIMLDRPRLRWNWAKLRRDISVHGVYNSLLVSPMPTASTAQILGNNESIDPIPSNIFVRRVLSGDFTVVNRHLLLELVRLGLWNVEVRDKVIANSGSIQSIPGIPKRLKEVYKTAWEISQKSVLVMAAERSLYIDQSQSLNIYMSEPTPDKLTSMHFFGWQLGLKTGMYYLRTQPAARAIQFTVRRRLNNVDSNDNCNDDTNNACYRAGGEACFNCSA